MMPMMTPMKTRAPRIPPTTAPVDGPGEICLCFSGMGETQRQTNTERKKENFITNSFEFHVIASGTLTPLTCNICIFMCFAAEVCVRGNSLSDSAVFH